MPEYEILELFIDGAWCAGSEGKSEPVFNPADETVLGDLPHASSDDLDRALAAAGRAFAEWRDVGTYGRAQIMRRAAQLMRERADAIATTLTLEEGKLFAESRAEVMTAGDITEWDANEGQRAYGRVIPGRAPGVRQLVLKEPVGPVAAFTPWNFPASAPSRKMAGALASGCPCIIKPSEETPGTAIALARCYQDAGLPAGVLNVVFGVPAEVSEHLIASPIIRKISFTGSIPVGKRLQMLAAEGLKRTTLELGGHAPVIVFDDADIAKVVKTVVIGKFRNAGQVCTSPSRFYVQDSCYDAFVRAFTDAAMAIKVGDGLRDGIGMGPLANPRRLDAMAGFVADARERGARVETGGERIGNCGCFFQPTVLSEIDDEARVMREEPFGPLAPISRFKDFDEVVERANSLEYGLASYAFTASEKTATAIADRLEAGMVAINGLSVTLPETPFGGVKESGLGSHGGIEGLDAHFNTKYVSQAAD